MPLAVAKNIVIAGYGALATFRRLERMTASDPKQTVLASMGRNSAKVG
jgi:hypothetical protein